MEKKLYRSETDKVLGGVCGGIAEYLNVDSTIVRLLWALCFFTSIGLIAYIVAVIVMPLPPTNYQNPNQNNSNPNNYNQNNYNQNNYNPNNNNQSNFSQTTGWSNSGSYQSNQTQNQGFTNPTVNSSGNDTSRAESTDGQNYYEAESHYKEEIDK